MNRLEAIQRFKNAINAYDLVQVSNGYIISKRETAVKYQHTRDVWEVDDENGKIRIENFSSSKMTVFNTIEYAKSIGCKGTIEFNLSQEEYQELKSLYFGNFKPDYEYLEKMKSSLVKK